MKRRPMYAALAALFVSVLTPILPHGGAALALNTADATGFTVNAIGYDANSAAAIANGSTRAEGAKAEPSLTQESSDSGPVLASAYMPATRYEYSRYRPRRDPYDRPRYREPSYGRVRGVAQIHAGFLDPDGSAEPGFLFGFRGGQKFNDMVEVGLGLDWRTKSGRATEVLQQTTGPGGEVIQVRRDLSSFSSNLFPGLIYLQLSGPSGMGVVPYAGVAGSWQVLFLKADDFQTGASYDATFDGFGWQVWGGAAFPLGGGSKLVGEVFLNNADLNRDVFDNTSGQTIRETVSTDGVGARFGINMGF